ncbi:MAG TPA: DUF2846 domain-containing protein [Blastocatellia bacterium]|nr:DUF2846 domain-containing protein [Blastocatellia bacterium]
MQTLKRIITLSCAVLFLSQSHAFGLASRQPQDDKLKPTEKADKAQSKETKADDKEIEAKACGTSEVNFNHKSVSSPPPNLEAPPDKALVIVVRPAWVGMAVQTKLAADGNWIGTNKGKSYFTFTLDPGDHYLCSKAENRSTLKLSVEAGKTYFVQQKVEMGLLKARNKIVQLDAAEGKKALEKCDLSISEVKK